MSKRVVYDVEPTGDGRWKVQREGSDRASNIFDRKSDAVERGRDLAKSQDLGQLRIKGENGRIQEERTYGDDPYPPRG